MKHQQITMLLPYDNHLFSLWNPWTSTAAHADAIEIDASLEWETIVESEVPRHSVWVIGSSSALLLCPKQASRSVHHVDFKVGFRSSPIVIDDESDAFACRIRRYRDIADVRFQSILYHKFQCWGSRIIQNIPCPELQSMLARLQKMEAYIVTFVFGSLLYIL